MGHYTCYNAINPKDTHHNTLQEENTMSRKHDPFIDYAMYSSIQSDREHGRPLGCGWCMLLFGGLTILYVFLSIVSVFTN